MKARKYGDAKLHLKTPPNPPTMQVALASVYGTKAGGPKINANWDGWGMSLLSISMNKEILMCSLIN